MNELEKFYIENERLAYKFGSSYQILHDEDIMQCIKIALWKACQTFDEKKNFAFSTYAYRCMYNEYMYSFRSKDLKYQYVGNIIYDKSGDEISIFDLMSNPKDLSIEDQIINSEMWKALYEYLETKSEKDRYIYISCQIKGNTQESLALKYNISQTGVSRIVKTINKELQEVLKDYN